MAETGETNRWDHGILLTVDNPEKESSMPTAAMTNANKGLSEQLLEESPIPLYMAGEWRMAAQGGVFDILDPADGSHLATVARATADDVDGAVAAASEASPGWAATPANDRAVLLHRLADLIDGHLDEIARLEARDVGKPIGDALDFDVPFSADCFRYFADQSVHVRAAEPIGLKGIEARQIRVPYGVCAFVVPWNFPLVLLSWGVAPALAAGNTVVVKPAELTPLTSLFICRLAEKAGVPPGVLNVVPGFGEEAGAPLVRHRGIKRLSFTGSTRVGRDVAQAAAANLVPAKLELGGKGAAVVFDDVDVETTAEALASAITLNAGQVCCTATRWIVQRNVFDQLISKASDHLSAVAIGPGTDDKTTMGPVVSETQRERILHYLDQGQDQGASFVLEGGAAKPVGAESGYYVSPALLTGPTDNICAREEIFGPVAYVLPFEGEQEAIDLANDTQYGLANSVWSEDLTRANYIAERLAAGSNWINAHNVFAYGLPYGGVNLSGAGGGVNSRQTYLDYLRHQTIARPTA